MIYWGTNFDLVGEYDNVVAENCKICSENSKPVYKVEQAYFLLYGLPLFPTGKKYYKTCPKCSTRLKVKSSDSNLRSVKLALPGKFKFKYVWGWMILLPIAIGIASIILKFKS